MPGAVCSCATLRTVAALCSGSLPRRGAGSPTGLSARVSAGPSLGPAAGGGALVSGAPPQARPGLFPRVLALGVRGKPGATRALGGWPRVSPATLAASTGGRHGAVGACAARSAAGPGHSSPVIDAAGTGVHSAFPGHWCGGVRRCFRGEEGGVWGTWNRGRDFPGPGAVPGSPVRFRIGPSLCLFTRVVEP
jgi:hypothetical protein